MTSIISIEKVEKVLKSKPSKILCKAIAYLSVFVVLGFFVYTVLSFAAWQVRDVPASTLSDWTREIIYGALIVGLLVMFVGYVLDDKDTLKELLTTSLGLISLTLVVCECVIPYMKNRMEEEQKKNPPIRTEAFISPILEPEPFEEGWYEARTHDCVEIYVSVYSFEEYLLMRRVINVFFYQEIKNKCIVEGDSIKFKF